MGTTVKEVSVMLCGSCVYYESNQDHFSEDYRQDMGACRRHAPTQEGWPKVIETMSCGDYVFNELIPYED